jgi:hypothetical protein
MGVNCSNCNTSNNQDEKNLSRQNLVSSNIFQDKNIFESSDGFETTKFENAKSSKSSHLIRKRFWDNNPQVLGQIIKIQSSIRRFRDSKYYRGFLEKHRV